MKKQFFTMDDFCDVGGYLLNPKSCVERANKKVEKLIELAEKVKRQSRVLGYPTTNEWFHIEKAASEILET